MRSLVNMYNEHTSVLIIMFISHMRVHCVLITKTRALCRNAGGRGERVGGAGTRAVSGPGTQARLDTRLSPASAPRSRRAPRPRGHARVVARRPPRPGVEVEVGQKGCALGRVRACSSGRYPRFTPAPVRQPRPSVTQRSGKRRHLRQQEAENLSGGLLPGLRRIPPVALPPPGL